MQTQCPYCQTIFRITAAHLKIAEGHVRCNRCQSVFNGSRCLVKIPPKSPVPKSYTPIQHPGLEAEFPELFAEDLNYNPHSWYNLLFWMFLSLLFAGLLVLQATWLWRPELYLQHPEVRPWLERLCYSLLCQLPPSRDISYFKMQDPPFIRLHPEHPHLIKVDAVFTNQASFPQPYPKVLLTFQDTRNQPLAQGLFKPTDYLPELDQREVVSPNASVHFRITLHALPTMIEGGKVAVGYTLDFQ